MDWLTLILIAIGLAMDAFAVSISNGILIGCANRRLTCRIAGSFGVFQGVMPMIGYWIAGLFAAQIKAIDHWVAFVLLGFIGGKMLYEGITTKCGEEGDVDCRRVTFGALIVQGIATSIDALSVGFTIAEYGFLEALLAAALIAGVTFVICYGGILIGRRVGTCLAGKAGILGGAILIFIGLEIFITSWF